MQETEKCGKVGGGGIARGKTKRCRSRWWRRVREVASQSHREEVSF